MAQGDSCPVLTAPEEEFYSDIAHFCVFFALLEETGLLMYYLEQVLLVCCLLPQGIKLKYSLPC